MKPQCIATTNPVPEPSQPKDKQIRHSARLNHDDSLKQDYFNRISKRFNEEIDTESRSSRSTTYMGTSQASSLTGQRKVATSRHRSNRPAELYRTDFITAMKLPDTETLSDYYLITDQWKLEYERGIQVPVNENNLNTANICYNPSRSVSTNRMIPSSTSSSSSPKVFPMPSKLLCPTDDKRFDSVQDQAYDTQPATAVAASKYDYDEMDANWLRNLSKHLVKCGEDKLSTDKFEKLIEHFETQSNDNLKLFLDNLKNYNIEYDEAIVCDVCRSPDSECSNEMVFCDGCNVCVHQACYGIEKIPIGTWLCGPCQFAGVAFKPDCLLCPNKNGALKPTRNLRNWCHVSCALWIPEIGFGNHLKLEPITNINKIPPARWQLTCSLCREKIGCCVQCSEKKCTTAFHITCAFKHGLLVEQTMSDNENVLSTCYCKEHSKTNSKAELVVNDSANVQLEDTQRADILSEDETELDSNEEERKFLVSLQSLSETSRKYAIVHRLEKMYARFYRNIDLEKARYDVEVKNILVVKLTFNYWKLKRRYNVPQNKALIFPRSVDDLVSQTENILQMRMNMFMHLRHDLERLRNLCYLVSRREKHKRSYFELDRECFQKQVEYLNKYKANTGNQYQSDYVPHLNLTSTLPGKTVFPQPSNHRNPTSYRVRDLLQFKNEKCIYDFPENWTVSTESTRIEQSNSKPAKHVHNVSKRILEKYDNICKKRRKISLSDLLPHDRTPSIYESKSPHKTPKSNIKDISINILNNNQRRLMIQNSTKKYSTTSTSLNSPTANHNRLVPRLLTKRTLKLSENNQSKENNRLLRKENLKELNHHQTGSRHRKALASSLVVSNANTRRRRGSVDQKKPLLRSTSTRLKQTDSNRLSSTSSVDSGICTRYGSSSSDDRIVPHGTLSNKINIKSVVNDVGNQRKYNYRSTKFRLSHP